MEVKKKFILASKSPRRQLLLRQIGVPFETRESGVDETIDTAKSPQENVEIISLRKAAEVARTADEAIVLGADTIVVLGNEILGKPGDEDEAKAMLRRLSGREHKVFTGIALVDRPSNHSVTRTEVTSVKFRNLSAMEIDEYVASGSPMDKAGAYGIQDDYGAIFVEKVNGCFYNVIGLPLARLHIMMHDFQKQLGLL